MSYDRDVGKFSSVYTFVRNVRQTIPLWDTKILTSIDSIILVT